MESLLDCSDFTDDDSTGSDKSYSSPKTINHNVVSNASSTLESDVVLEESSYSSSDQDNSTGAVKKPLNISKRTSHSRVDSQDEGSDENESQNTSRAFTSYRDSLLPTRKKGSRKPLIDSDSDDDDSDEGKPKIQSASESDDEYQISTKAMTSSYMEHLNSRKEKPKIESASESDEEYQISTKAMTSSYMEHLNSNKDIEKSQMESSHIGTLRNRYTEVFKHTNDNILSSTAIEPNLTPVHDSIKSRTRSSVKNSTSTPVPANSQLSANTTPKVTQSLDVNTTPNSSSVLILSDEEEFIDVSSGEEYGPPKLTPKKTPMNKIDRALNRTKQVTLDALVKKNILEGPKEEVKPKKSTLKSKMSSSSPNQIEVSPSELKIQQDRVSKLQIDLSKAINMLRTINLKALPDGGQLIINRHKALEERIKIEQETLNKMIVTKEDSPSNIEQAKSLAWEDIQAGANAVLPKTFGKQAMSTYNAQKALTMDRLHQLHGSLATCPKEDEFAEDPKGLKIQLMPHQRRALTWLMWRETQKPSGGILADDMGLGKTLTMISLMLKTKEVEDKQGSSDDEENEPNRNDFKHKGGTLVVCPASLLQQWSGELERRAKRGLASYELYHGPKRETKSKILAQYDMVITTYAIANNEADKRGAIYKIKWRRIVLDEAHQIRNYKSQTSEAVCRLSAKSRWALTGTPVHNKELDMFALLKFLRCSPFDDLQVWKRWVGDKSTGGTERLHTVISSLMLRRTKAELMEKGALNCMPTKKWELVPVELHKNEMAVYQKVLIFSRTLFAQFLHQRAEKNQDAADYKFMDMPKNGPNEEYFKMRSKLLKFNKVKDVSQHEILVLLLRLRQICNHPTLITAMLNDDCKEDLGSDEEMDEMNLLDQLNKLNIEDDNEYHANMSVGGIANDGNNGLSLKDASKGFLNPSNPVFSANRLSSKIACVMELLKERVLSTGDKAIIVSQWAGFLRIIAIHLKDAGIDFGQFDGSVPVNKRMAIVDAFNNPTDKMKVLLLSLTAGGVGLNLVGANHLFLLDLHWNPQLENQAQDRIYRVGQMKSVFVYKFMATDTIEERIKALQERKLEIADAMLTGSKQVIQSKLSLQDLKMLFDM